MLTARTLAEDQTYISVMAATDPPLDVTLRPTRQDTTLTEGAEAWTLSYVQGADLIQVEVPYMSEDVARRTGVMFGLGVSQLIDAGQWSQVAATYARRAFDRDFSLTDGVGTPDERRLVELDWEFAAEAQGEVVKFLPDGADEIPPEAFWSELDTRVHTDQPELFTREKVLDDYEYYRGTLEDFRSLHGRSD
jgi:hypothetical protein